ncbi:MAG: RND family transporter [Deltaproteobacteria bacterium]|nr:RND family transporter [Deltaproteobacteria bacterium]
MAHGNQDPQNVEVCKTPLVEKFIFRFRAPILIFLAVASIFLGYQALHMKLEASFEKMIPTYHPFIQNYLKHKDELKGLGNVIWISVENTKGDIFDPKYLDTLQKITDDVFFIPGVERSGVKSLWMPIVRWKEVTEEGFDGGPVIPDTYDGSPQSIALLKRNVMRSGEIGKLVANNFKSSMVIAPLQEINPETGKKLDYLALSHRLEKEIRDKYQNDEIKIHIIGFAKLVGDLMEGASSMGLFFLITILLTTGLLYFYTRCIRATLMPVLCALLAVIWQAGILKLFGYGLDPYSMLVPFLVFAVGISHGVQMISGIKHQTMLGRDKFDAARFAFRLLYLSALCALVTDGVGFATLYVIKIGVLQDMAVGALVRFPVLILGMLICLPLLMSYFGVSKRSIELLYQEEEKSTHPLWSLLSKLADRKRAIAVLVIVAVAASWGFHYRQGLQIGDLDRGAPELRPDSRYNQDNAFIVDNYSTTSDLFVIMLETPKEGNSKYPILVDADNLQASLMEQPGVQSTQSIVNYMKLLNAAYNEGNFKWWTLPRSQVTLDSLAMQLPPGVASQDGTMSPIFVYLDDHKAKTLDRVVKTVEKFTSENKIEGGKFLMAAGPAGIEAATNIEIEKAQTTMLLLVYGVVIFLVFLTFRSIRATICIIIPLALTSLLCEVLMTWLGIGVKVATLPVISVGVGIGVDYGVYIYNRLTGYLEQGMDIVPAYFNTLKTTGKAVAFTGITLAMGVATWSFSPIKFQADMGILLTFMFLWNMIGAIVLLPALGAFIIKVKPKPQCIDN